MKMTPIRLAWRGSLAVLCALGTTALAQNKPEKEESLAPSKPPLVLQNRYFLKKLRPELSLHGGQVLNESYSQTFQVGARAGLFITETLGVEYTFDKYLGGDSDDLKALRKLEYCGANGEPDTTCKRVEPSFVRLESGHSATLTFAPIYGKINLLEGYILYSDIYANVGAGMLGTSQGSKPTAILGVGQRFYFAKSFNVRVDAVDHIFQEERTNGTDKTKNVRNAWTVSLGVSAFLTE
jgi:outer membrane beta-barrel protein